MSQLLAIARCERKPTGKNGPFGIENSAPETRGPRCARALVSRNIAVLVESSGGVSKQSVNLACLGGEICPGNDLTPVIVRDFFEQSLELADVAVHRAHEIAVAAILP